MDTFQINLTGPGIAIEREISQEVAEQVTLLILTGSKGHAQNSELESISLSEFLSACLAKRNPERFVAIAYFLKKYRNRMSFDKNDLVDGFEEAGEQFPANFSRDFKCVKNAGWIALKYGRRGTFYVTKSGHSAVEAKFPSAPRQKGHKMKGVGNNNGTGDAETIGQVTEVETE